MSRTALKLTAATALVLTGGLALTACSGSDAGADTEAAGPSTTVSVDGASIATGGGEWSASVDGKAVEMEDSTVVCAEQGGDVSLTVASSTLTSATGLSAVLSADDLQVRAVGMGSTDSGEALAFADGAPGNEATATRDGDTYTITGTLTSMDADSPMAGPVEKSFELSVTCP